MNLISSFEYTFHVSIDCRLGGPFVKLKLVTKPLLKSVNLFSKSVSTQFVPGFRVLFFLNVFRRRSTQKVRQFTYWASLFFRKGAPWEQMTRSSRDTVYFVAELRIASSGRP